MGDRRALPHGGGRGDREQGRGHRAEARGAHDGEDPLPALAALVNRLHERSACPPTTAAACSHLKIRLRSNKPRRTVVIPWPRASYGSPRSARSFCVGGRLTYR